MKFLVDTNILIAIEPVQTELEPTARVAAEFVGMALTAGHSVVRHEAQEADRARDRDADRSRARDVLFQKYPRLGAVRALPEIDAELGSPADRSNAWVDNQLLIAVKAGVVDFLVTEDQGAHSKAARVGITDQVLTAAEARQMLAALLPGPPAPLPSIEWIKAAQLDNDPIFDSIVADTVCARYARWGGYRITTAWAVLIDRETLLSAARGGLLVSASPPRVDRRQ